MSETNIIGKPLTPTIKTSTLDGHRITTPVPRPVRGGSEVKDTQRAAHGGQPLRTGAPDIAIGRGPAVDHVTSSSSSRTTTVQAPPVTRPGRQAPNPALVPPSQRPVIARDEAELMLDLVKSHHDSLPTDAKHGRELAARAAKTVAGLAAAKLIF